MSENCKKCPDDESKLREQLSRVEKTYNTVKLSKLPDGGAKLREKMDSLKLALEKMTLSDPVKSEVTVPVGDKTSDASKEHVKESKVEPAKSSPIETASSAVSKNGDFVEKVSDFLSFKDLSEKVSQSSSMPQFKELPKTPSFTSYRSRQDETRTKYTDAQPLPIHLPAKQKLNFQSGFNSAPSGRVLTTAKEEAVINIHNSLATCPSALIEEKDPEKLTTPLMKHQKQGLPWLLWRETQNPSGGILADDMGLGKTLTMISLILKAAERDKNAKSTLIVCLASVIHQWHSEIIKHCKKGAVTVQVYHGTNRERDVKIMESHNVVLTTYNLILYEGKNSKGRSPLFNINWQRIILDEAHTIKNYKSQTAEYVFKLSSISRWAVTGTPIHNDLKDFYCLLKYLRCRPFDDYKVWKKLMDDFSEHSVKRRNALIKSILLRRTKDQKDELGTDLIQLPEKSTIIHAIRLSEKEMKLYDEIQSELKTKLDKYFELTSSNKKSPGKPFGTTLLTLLLKLQQCCNHPNLVKTSVVDESTDSFGDILGDFSSLNIGDKNTSGTDSSTDIDISFGSKDFSYPVSEESAKIRKLLKKVAMIQDEYEKIVIVSQWVSMLDIVALHLDKGKVKYHVIRGSTKVEDRNFIAQDFNNNPDGPRVLLLSLKAGGTGLNLVGGNHLFLLDLHWNPALEMQASDRIHRVGQQRPVYIHKFVCKCTIEEKILQMQNEKKMLAETVLDGAKRSYAGLTMDDLKDLFR